MPRNKDARLTKPKGKAQQPRGLTGDMLRAVQTVVAQVKATDGGGRPHLTIPQPPPGVIPKGAQAKLAHDSAVNGFNGWAVSQLQNSAIVNGIVFLGFPYLSELAQVAEYRYIAEVTATEMTREWIDLKSVSTKDVPKDDRIKELDEFMKTMDVEGAFRRMVELDYLFGRSHLYLDTGDTDNPDELKLPIGNGRDIVTRSKVDRKKGFLKAVRAVEPVWCYPAEYTSNDPLKPDWYNPQSWYALGKQVHVSRLLTFVGREVPDMLKPAFMFGGLPMSQMAQVTVNNWLRARKSVSDLLYKYSVNVLSTEMDAITTEGAANMLLRVQLFSQLMNNNGVMMIDKGTETFANVSTPLSGIEQLQAQAQEHMSAVSRIPLVKLTGISPSGLNASSEGEIQVWYEWVKAYQEKFFSKHLDTVIAFSMISLWGEVDPDIVWEFRPLRSLSEKEMAELRKLNSETDVNYAGTGAIGPDDLRRKLSSDPMSPYDSLEDGDADTDEADGMEDEVDRDMGAILPRLTREMGRDPGERGGGREERPARTARPARGARPRTPREQIN